MGLSCPRLHRLPEELGADLSDAAVDSRAGHQAKLAWITGRNLCPGTTECATGIIELRVVENVEEFGANFESHGFLNSGALGNTKIRDVKSGSVKELAIGVAELPQRS